MNKTPLMRKIETSCKEDIKNILEKKYVEKLHLPSHIAKEFNIHTHTVYAWLDHVGITKRDHSEAQLAIRKIKKPESLELKIAHHDEKKPLYAIAKKVGVNKGTMYAWFKREKIEIKKGGNYPLPSWPSREKLEKLYINQKKRMWQVAKETGFCINTITKIFNYYGIKRRNQSEAMLSKKARKPGKEELDWEYAVLKSSPGELASKYGVWPKTIHRWLKAYAINIRNSSESRLPPNASKPARDRLLSLYIDHGISVSAQICGTTPATFKRWLKKEQFIVSENGHTQKNRRQELLGAIMRRKGRTLESLTAHDFFSEENKGDIAIINWYSRTYRTTPSDALEYIREEIS